MRRDAKKLGLGGRNIIEEVKEKKERRNRQKRSLNSQKLECWKTKGHVERHSTSNL